MKLNDVISEPEVEADAELQDILDIKRLRALHSQMKLLQRQDPKNPQIQAIRGKIEELVARSVVAANAINLSTKTTREVANEFCELIVQELLNRGFTNTPTRILTIKKNGIVKMTVREDIYGRSGPPVDPKKYKKAVVEIATHLGAPPVKAIGSSFRGEVDLYLNAKDIIIALGKHFTW